MPQFNISWKGYPHRHLPRIRVATPPHSFGHRHSLSQLAARDVVRSPLGFALEKERLRQRIAAHQSNPSSRTSSVGLSRRRRASRRSKRNIKLFGWKDSRFILTDERVKAKNTQTHPNINRRSRTFSLPGVCDMGSRVPASHPNNQYSMVHPSEDIASQDEKSKVEGDVRKVTDAGAGKSSKRGKGEEIPIRIVNLGVNKAPHSHPEMLERRFTYDPRLPVKRLPCQPKSFPIQGKQSGQLLRSSRGSKKSSGSKRLDRTANPSNQAIVMSTRIWPSSSTSQESVMTEGFISEIPSRTSSLRKALKQFSQDLERHLIAQEAIRNTSLTNASTSGSCMSARTIAEFIPYKAEFLAAGLAVTSSDQRRQLLPNSVPLIVPPEIANDGAYSQTMPDKVNGQGVSVDQDDHIRSTEGSETTYTSTISSSSTVIGLLPFKEPPYVTLALSSSDQKNPAKKTLPWLRNAENASSVPMTGQKDKGAETLLNQSTLQHRMSTLIDVAKSKNFRLKSDAKAKSSTPTFAVAFRASPQLFKQHKSTQTEDLRPAECMANILQSPSLSAPTRPTPLPPLCRHEDARSNQPSSSCALPQTPMPSDKSCSHYDYENPSIFEQALEKVIEVSQSQEGVMEGSSSRSFKGLHVGDPTKRKAATPYITSRPCPQSTTVTSLEFEVSSKTAPVATKERPEICNVNILKGLQVATTAACNKDIDGWVSEVSGFGVRRFLSDLSAFDGLGINALAEQAKKNAMRREKMYKERTEIQGQEQTDDKEGKEYVEKPKGKDRNLGLVAADESARRGLLLQHILRMNDARASESVKERAIKMGWRGRSVSAGG